MIDTTAPDPTTPDWLNRLNNVFSSPAINGLAGMTAGFAQAAMPSRVPIPFGAALGLGVNGLMAGGRAAYGTELARQQAEAARIANQRANILLNYFGGQFGNGTSGSAGTATPGGGTAVPTMAGSGAPMGAAPGNGYLMTPQSIISRGDLAMMTGQDRAAAQLYGMPNTMAGGAGYAMGANNAAFPVPGGPHDPSVISRNTYAAEIPKANVETWQKFNTPGEQPGGVFGTPSQTIGAPPWIGGPQAGAAPSVPQSAGAPPKAPSTAPQLSGYGGAATTPDPFPEIAARINGIENPTGNAGAQNPASSAAGNGQFLAGTFPTVIRAARPDLAAGKTDAELLPLRSIPGVSLDATTQYARMNAAKLSDYGLPVTPGTIYMAHGLGADGAAMVLRATPQTPVSMILPAQVIAANPYLQGKTAGDVRAYYEQKMGATQVAQTNGQTAQVAGPGAPTTQSTAPPAAPPLPGQNGATSVAPGVVQRPGPGGSVVTTDTRQVQAQLFAHDMKDLGEATDEAKAIQGNMTRLYEMRDQINALPQMGSGGEFRAHLANMVQTYIKPIPGIGAAADDFLHKVADLPDAEAAQLFAKLSLQAAGLQEKSTVGARGSLGLTRLFLQANPNINMLQNPARDIANLQLVQHQMELDYLRGLHDHVLSNGTAFSTGQANYVPAAQFDKQWVAQDNNKVYFAATQALNGKPFAEWSKLLGGDRDPGKLQAAIDVVRRVDPNAQIMWQDGKPHVFAPQPGGGG